MVDVTLIGALRSRVEGARSVLSEYLGCDSAELEFGTEPFGKPALVRPRLNEPVDFSVSWCDGRCLVAVGRGVRIGVDVERRRSLGDLDRIASIYFSSEEAGAIAASRNDAKLDAFFDCWTSKEAYTKAIGTGLLTRFECFAFPIAGAKLPSVVWTTIEGEAWTLYRFEPWPAYAAAVVVSGHISYSAFHIGDPYVDLDS